MRAKGNPAANDPALARALAFSQTPAAALPGVSDAPSVSLAKPGATLPRVTAPAAPPAEPTAASLAVLQAPPTQVALPAVAPNAAAPNMAGPNFAIPPATIPNVPVQNVTVPNVTAPNGVIPATAPNVTTFGELPPVARITGVRTPTDERGTAMKPQPPVQPPAGQRVNYEIATGATVPGVVQTVGSAPSGRVAQRGSKSWPDETLPEGGESAFSKRLEIPRELPGADAPQIRLPPIEPEESELRSEIVRRLFPRQKAPPTIAPPPGVRQRPKMTLRELEELALANNPLLVQAAGDVVAARGSAIQAGVHPNPVIGYEADTVGSGNTRNYSGVYASQVVKTAGKLGLARAAANMELMNSQLQMRRTRFDVLRDVRAGYFAVLVAHESVAINAALVRFTNEAYRVQVDQLENGEGTAYEPAQMRTLAVQARSALVQSENRYISAWKQLAASVGVLDLPPADLEGRADMAVPVLSYDALLAWILSNHPDVLAARNLEAQARLQLRLQQVTPIPDLQMYGTFQRDFTTPSLPRTTYNLQIGVPVPVFDRNRGNIMSAEGRLRSAAEQIRRVRNELTTALADAFERFETARTQSQFYREQILPDLARAYRGVYERHQQEPDQVGFGDIIVAQQNLATGIATYVTSLGAQWTAVADLANLLQLEDLRMLYNLPNRPLAEALPAPPAAPKP